MNIMIHLVLALSSSIPPGGALTSAKSAVSGWWSSWRATDKSEVTGNPTDDTITTATEGDANVNSDKSVT